MNDPQYWPFDIVPNGRRPEEDAKKILFLKTAYGEGFRPSRLPTDDYSVASPGGRFAYIVWRGPNRWEVMLTSPDGGTASRFVGDFADAAAAALAWMRRAEVEQIGTPLANNTGERGREPRRPTEPRP